jgi:mycothiol synthase
MTSTDAAATAAEIPGLVLRPYAGEADIPEILRISNSDFAHDGLDVRTSLEELRAEYSHASESFDPARDILVAEVDGRPVGYVRVDWVDTNEGLREHRSGGAVDGEWRRQGIGTAMLRAAQDVMLERARELSTDRPRAIGMWVDERQAGRTALATANGYEPVRWFFEMERAGIDRDLPDVPPMPEGLEVRPVGRDEARAVWSADHEAFRDHWGGFDDSEASFLRWVESPEFQPEGFLVAYDGDEVAGAVLNVIYRAENQELGLRRGWLDSVFTRRAWRGRGLARALIMRSFHVLAGMGMDTAALGVDADNPSGALGLYESCGFTVVRRSAAWRRPWPEEGR